MRLISILATLAVLCLATGPAVAEDEVAFEWGVKIPMRDGVNLNATIYRPVEMDGPLPVIVTITPYLSDRYHPDAQFFAANGYVFAIVDVRGRGNSEGKFNAFINDARDGHDVVEWLGAQPWSDGRVAMRGGSYGGYNQWMTAAEFPGHLKTIVPIASPFIGVDFPMTKNIMAAYEIRWLTLVSGVTPNNNTFGGSLFWNRIYKRLFLDHAAFSSFDRYAGNITTEFQDWVAHPTRGAYWDALNPSDQDYAGIDLPTLTITGAYDGDQSGAMEHYRRHMRLGSEAAKARHYLIIGPWDHSGTRGPKSSFGGLKVGDASLLEVWELDKAWYDWTMKEGAKPAFLKDRVAYFVAGANQWKYAPSLGAVSEGSLDLYLTSGSGGAGGALASGALVRAKPDGGGAPDGYVYDPLDVSSAEFDEKPEPNYITDQREVLRAHGDGLIYHSAPFDADTEISGYIELEAWMALDVPDTDFVASLYEILPDGSSIFLASDFIRARYRRSLYEAELVEAGEINRYVFDGFRFFSRKISRGSRLRLFIRAPNSLFFQKNYNSGGIVADETGADARTAHITLYHDAEHASRLILPLGIAAIVRAD